MKDSVLRFGIRILADIRTILEVDIYTPDKIFINLAAKIRLQKSSHLFIGLFLVSLLRV